MELLMGSHEGVSKTRSFGWSSVEEVLHGVGDHVKGEGWWGVRHVKCLKVLSDHVGRKGVEKDVASFGTGDGLLP